MNPLVIQPRTLLLKHITKGIIFLLLFLVLLSIRSGAQNINGFKIEISADTATEFTFNAKIESWQFDDENGFLTYDISLVNDYKMKVIAKKATAEVLQLNVTEGKRKHKFILLYKEGTDGIELNHDYSDLQALEKLVKGGTGEKKTDEKLIELVAEADKAFLNQQYEEANAKYQQASRADSSNDHVKKRLVETDAIIANKKNLAQKTTDEKFNNAILKANGAWLSKNYDEAINAYTEALAIKPEDTYAKTQILAINKKIEEDKLAAANKKTDSLFNSYMDTGNKALSEKSYDAAATAYNQALTIKPGNPIATGALKNLENHISINKQQEENAKIDAIYKSYIAAADKAYLDKLYEESKIAYTQALNIKPVDQYANDQVKKIDNELSKLAAQKELDQKNKAVEDQYNALINLADSAFNMQMWELAKEEYSRAFQLLNRSYPQQKIAEIDKKLTELNNLEIAAKQKGAKDSIDSAKYNALLEKADNYFDKKEYDNAKSAYEQALRVKDEQYAKDRLTETTNALAEISLRNKAEKDSLEKENEVNKKYSAIIAKARIAYANDDYVNARAAYEAAAELKPDEEEPKTGMQQIDNKLLNLVKAKEIQDKYDSLTGKANLALSNNEYENALASYKEALAIKPDELYYLQKQISYLERQLTIRDSTQVEVKKTEDRKKKFNEGMNAYNDGRRALKELRYEDALSAFQKFLELIPDVSELNTNQYNQEGLINFARAKVKDLQEYLARMKPNGAAKDSIHTESKPATDTSKQKSQGSTQYKQAQKNLKIAANNTTPYRVHTMADIVHDKFLAMDYHEKISGMIKKAAASNCIAKHFLLPDGSNNVA